MSYEIPTPSLPLRVSNRETGLPFVRWQLRIPSPNPECIAHSNSLSGGYISRSALARTAANQLWRTQPQISAALEARPLWAEPTHLQNQLVSKRRTCLYILWT
ncbi:unnamed protein product [Pipistrellus nathusii]|uniref:Uncharacterized protein n=1 Tax=Pipistrellus nathusii TaxID=59473 RepID=A0ABN9ZSE4_PIPNA